MHVSTKLNRNHLITGEQALILPCLGRTEKDAQTGGEQFVSCENSMGVVQSSRGVLKPASPHLMSETAIICNLAAATLQRPERRSIGLAYAAITTGSASISSTSCRASRTTISAFASRAVSICPIRRAISRNFHTDVGKAKFHVHPIPRADLQPGELMMMSIRSHDQFNTTIYGENDRYRGILRRPPRDLHAIPTTCASLGFEKGQWVDLTSHFEGDERHAQAVHGRAVRHSAALCGDLLSGVQSAGAAKARGRRQQPTGQQIDRDHARAGGSCSRWGGASRSPRTTIHFEVASPAGPEPRLIGTTTHGSDRA